MPTVLKRLKFACDCVSSRQGDYSDPWAAVSQHKLLPDGTKEEIINLLFNEPKTISQLAEALKLSPPSIHTHVTDMIKSELLRESEEWEKRYPTERYYEPNFPVVKAAERAEFNGLCEEIAGKIAELFEKRLPELEEAYKKTGLAERGWEFSEMTQYLYTSVQRDARKLLERQGLLPEIEKRANGTEWLFWAEEPRTSSTE